MNKKSIGLFTATSIVIANMIGTGVFTSLGFQLAGIHSGFALILLWIIGGLAALLGSLCYGELGTLFPRSGGEYNYLSKIYHPSIGFLSGWVSVTVGFSAPVAAAAMALGAYAHSVSAQINPTMLALIVVLFLTLVHAYDVRSGVRIQNIFTTLKVIFVLIIICCGLFTSGSGTVSFSVDKNSCGEVFSPAFAISLFWVSYAYSGWNASAYIAGEIDEPKKNIPRSLFMGTLFVTILYVLLNFVFLKAAPASEITLQKEVGFIAANYIFGPTGGKIIAGIIALLLVSSVSSMIIAGPRVTQTMGEDIKLLNIFAKRNKNGSPVYAIVVQSVLSVFFILTSTFDQVIMYIGFTLSLFTFLTVLGLIIARFKNSELPRPFKTPFYPITPIVFLSLTGWIIYYGLTIKQKESLMGLATVLSGLMFYFLNKIKNKPESN